MKYLVIGDAGSLFIKQYIEYVLLGSQNEIVLLQEGTLTDDYKEFYQNSGVILESLWEGCEWVQRIPRIRSIIGVSMWCKRMKQKYKEFDCVHVHGVSRSRGDMALGLRGICKQMIITVWGDELFRYNKRLLAKFEKYYTIADKITVATKKMQGEFINLYGEKYADRLLINRFAIGVFDRIDEVKNNFTRQELCDSFGIKCPEKFIVFVGHNGRPAQRHIDITKSLLSLPSKYSDKITLVYTMTYGVPDEHYIDEILAVSRGVGCDVVVFREFMNEDTVARLRNVCDILIHAQLTDAFSASIQESLYHGSIILNGSWLPYDELPNYENSMVIYDNLSDIPSKLIEVIDNYDEYKAKVAVNKDVLKSISSKEITTAQWKKTISKAMQ